MNSEQKLSEDEFEILSFLKVDDKLIRLNENDVSQEFKEKLFDSGYIKFAVQNLATKEIKFADKNYSYQNTAQ